MTPAPRFDEIHYWSEVKLDIIRDYAQEYSRILAAQRDPSLRHVYIDGFSGAGEHKSRRTGQWVSGSPLNALRVRPPFCEYYLIDLDGDKVEHLRGLVGDRKDVQVLHGDCNDVLLSQVFPRVRYEDYRRGLCLLDPYGLQLNWEVTSAAGKMGTLDVFINFPVYDMNRNALWRHPDRLPAERVRRMTAFWGDESWRDVVYKPSAQLGLFDTAMEKAGNNEIAEAFRARLHDVAGFAHVLQPLPMRNSKSAIVYYLFFASQKDVANRIVRHIFKAYAERGR